MQGDWSRSAGGEKGSPMGSDDQIAAVFSSVGQPMSTDAHGGNRDNDRDLRAGYRKLQES